MSDVTVRAMREADLGRVGALAADLVRLHHAWDADRFFVVDDVEAGYRAFFGRQLRDEAVVLLVAEVDGEVAGYAYGVVEARDWNLLLDRHGALHDIEVDARFRGRGVGRRLLQAALDAFTARGAPRVVLMTATQNGPGQALFEALGFRRTMVEMTWTKP